MPRITAAQHSSLGLRAIIDSSDDLTVVAEAENGAEAVELAAKRGAAAREPHLSRVATDVASIPDAQVAPQ